MPDQAPPDQPARVRIAEITVRAATYPTVTVSYDDLAAAWRKSQGIPDDPRGVHEYPEPHQMEDREWYTGPLADLLTPLLGDTGDADLRIDSVNIRTIDASAAPAASSPAVALTLNHWAAALEDPGPVTAGPFPRPARFDSDACADAMTVLHDEILSMTPAAQQEHAEGLLCDLMDLTGDNLSGPGRAEVISRALNSAPAMAGSGDPETRALLAAAEIMHDRGAPAETVNMLRMYARLGKPLTVGGEHVRRIGHFTDAGGRPVEIGVDHDLMTFSVGGVTARLNREQRFTQHALQVAATIAIDTYNAATGDHDAN